MSACYTAGSISVNAAIDGCKCAAVPLVHANQLPLPKLKNAAGHRSGSRKQHYGKCLTFDLKDRRRDLFASICETM